MTVILAPKARKHPRDDARAWLTPVGPNGQHGLWPVLAIQHLSLGEVQAWISVEVLTLIQMPVPLTRV